MKLKMPFVKNKTIWKGKGWCGPISLASILRYYELKDKVTYIVENAGTKELRGGTTPNGLINFCLKKGLWVDYFSDFPYESEKNKNFSKEFKIFLKKANAENNDKNFYLLNKSYKKFKYKKRRATLKDIEKYLDRKVPVLITNNVAIICGKGEELWPHYVVVVGYDPKNYYIHNIYPKNQKYQKVSKNIFNKFWKCGGLDNLMIAAYK